MKKGRAGQLVRSASRRGKTSSRFQFDITIDTATGVRSGSSYYVKWARGVKIASTKTVVATKDNKRGLPFHQKLSLLVTLYRDESKKSFDDKDAKLYLILVTPKKQERTVAKVHFNLSDFAGVPSASTQKNFSLSEKVQIKTKIESRFLKSGKGGPGSDGASSALSGITGVSDRSSDPDDDFDDLNIDDIPEPELPPRPSKRTSSKRKSVLSPTTSQDITSVSNNAVSEANPKSAKSGAPKSLAAVAAKRDTRAGDSRTELENLQMQCEKLNVELRRSQDKRKRMESAHQAELVAMKLKLSTENAARGDELLGEMTERAKGLQTENGELKEKLDEVIKEREELTQRATEADKLQSKNRDLTEQLDRATVAAAVVSSDRDDGGAAAALMEERLATARKEKEVLESKLKAHQAHADKVRDTYEKLSAMYTNVREENIQLQQDLEAAKAAADAASSAVKGSKDVGDSAAAAAKIAALEAQLCPLESQVRASNARAQDAEAERAQSKSDLTRTTAQLSALQLKMDRTVQELQKARETEDSLLEEATELKGQRDAALKRALSKRSSSGSPDGMPQEAGLAAAVLAVRNEGAAKMEKAERDLVRERERVAELEEELTGLADDLEYEKGEKARAREERDALREQARSLERRTAESGRAKDSVQSLQRKISTHIMREEDLQSVVKQLRNDIARLEQDVEDARALPASSDEVGEILEVLVKTKLQLAQAEDDKLELMFAMKTLKKTERAMQERLASHASSLEVRLGEASEKIEALQRKSKNGGPSPSRRLSSRSSNMEY